MVLYNSVLFLLYLDKTPLLDEALKLAREKQQRQLDEQAKERAQKMKEVQQHKQEEKLQKLQGLSTTFPKSGAIIVSYHKYVSVTLYFCSDKT